MTDGPTTYSPEQTRRALLDAARDEIWTHGYQAARLDRILNEAGVTKGALYHHFRNKRELGYAVVDERVRDEIRDGWIEPLAQTDDPVRALLDLVGDDDDGLSPEQIRYGCPLTNLSREMAPVDEGFRERIQGLFRDWRDAIAAGLRRGQQAGTIRGNLDPDACATCILAILVGSETLAKAEQSADVLPPCRDGLRHYLEALRPRRSFRND